MGEEPEAQALGPISYLVLEFRVSAASQSLGGSGPAGVLPTGTAVRPAAVRSPRRGAGSRSDHPVEAAGELHSEGILTDAEFEAQKAKILNS